MDFDINMLAYCGLYCEQCSFKIAEQENNMKHLENAPRALIKSEHIVLSDYKCECCKGNSICGACRIKACASTKAINSCAECTDFPCTHIDSFAKDGFPHHAKAFENLKSIRRYGIDAWAEELCMELKCSCGGRKTWYYVCSNHC